MTLPSITEPVACLRFLSQNPQNITVRRFDYNKGNKDGIITEIYKFPRNALEGIWGVSVEHGHEVNIYFYYVQCDPIITYFMGPEKKYVLRYC